MTKRAVCVGINDYPIEGMDLHGCVNDANQWAELLRARYEFSGGDIELLLDGQATKAAIIAALKRLLAGARDGDVLAFTNSSHGTYVADTDHDEPGYDEAICPWDVTDNLIVDDDLRKLFTDLRVDAHLVVISDSCFSGTLTRAAVAENIPGMATPDARRIRFLSPALLGRAVITNPIARVPKERVAFPESGMNHILMSGASDHEYSYDAAIDGAFHGAMTYHAIKAISAAGYRLTYAELHDRLQPMLEAAGYFQHPQLEGKASMKDRQLFS
jgi:metacaspase-1